MIKRSIVEDLIHKVFHARIDSVLEIYRFEDHTEIEIELEVLETGDYLTLTMFVEEDS